MALCCDWVHHKRQAKHDPVGLVMVDYSTAIHWQISLHTKTAYLLWVSLPRLSCIYIGDMDWEELEKKLSWRDEWLCDCIHGVALMLMIWNSGESFILDLGFCLLDLSIHEKTLGLFISSWQESKSPSSWIHSVYWSLLHKGKMFCDFKCLMLFGIA